MSYPLPQAQPQQANGPPCRMLRTKTAFGFIEDDEAPWYDNGSTTAVYWCLGTMETAGLDDQYCHPTTCRPGRLCYQDELE
ncbi:MAG TPA: hypothetical protein VER17_07490 [Tepidisphaeraceae bacterium]|nr:hypothetical protein [Tepidisphaeraceae bacterium]